MDHICRKLIGLVAITLLVIGCGNQVEGDEDEPFDERDNELVQGIYDCSERSDTGYRSGSPFSIKVVTVDGRPVEVNTANAYIAMQAKAKQAGVNLRIVSGFRTMAQQQYLYGCYVNCNCNGCNLAARPGYSNHQSGHALDLNTSDPGVYTWLSNNASRYGFRRTVPSEAWHWEWWGSASDFDGPCGVPQIPEPCRTGRYSGEFCDDDGKSSEEAHNRLKRQLGVDFHCADMGGNPAFCGNKDATRAHTIFVLGKAAQMPINGHPNAFVDDDGHAREKYFNAAKAFGIMNGYSGRKVKPNEVATRNTLAVVLSRMYALPPATRDYFDDDDGDANEAAHNKVAAAGLIMGYADANGGRRDFKGSMKATRDMLAIVAVRAHDKGLIPVWEIPQPCLSGNYNGSFCDDDGQGIETNIERLVGELGVPFSCRALAGSPAFCASKDVSRANAMYVLGKAANIPLGGYPNGFRDDDGHARERYLDAAKAWGILGGYNGGRDVRPDKIANRTTLAIMLSRIYDLPDASQDYFSDDNGTSAERWHNKVAAAGLFTGYNDGRGGKEFRGEQPATRGQLATLAVRAKDRGLVPIWAPQAPAPAPAPPPEEEPETDESAPSVDDVGEEEEPALEPDDVSLDDEAAPEDLPAPDEDNPLYADEDGAVEGPPEGITLDAPPETPPSVRSGCSAAGADISIVTLLILIGARLRRGGAAPAAATPVK